MLACSSLTYVGWLLARWFDCFVIAFGIKRDHIATVLGNHGRVARSSIGESMRARHYLVLEIELSNDK